MKCNTPAPRLGKKPNGAIKASITHWLVGGSAEY